VAYKRCSPLRVFGFIVIQPMSPAVRGRSRMLRGPLSVASDLPQPLIINPGDVLPWRARVLHCKAASAQVANFSALLLTFHMPGAASAPAEHIKLHENGLSFSHPGFYFFSIPCGCLKVLVKDPAKGDMERCIEIAAFVSACTVHSQADFHRVGRGSDYDLR